MRRGSSLVVIVGLMMASGCASHRSAQEINRLKSDVGILDERVSQLERASLKEPSTAALPSEPQLPSAAVTEGAVPLTVKPSKSSGQAAAKSSSSVKPSKKEIQQALKAAGFYQGPVDGKLGPQTREAIRSFQQVHGLKMDGVVGRQTWEKLSPYLNSQSAGAESSELSAAESLK
ncbi:MAG: peptidoglycan-binding protein [Candidatus Omnitrophica bacterium]|nr:peptidoglycan-binding protein [Candidatus Omnitrophota bacterium]